VGPRSAQNYTVHIVTVHSMLNQFHFINNARILFAQRRAIDERTVIMIALFRGHINIAIARGGVGNGRNLFPAPSESLNLLAELR
jgi:hypothetical protein